jgi:hypothetical protein
MVFCLGFPVCFTLMHYEDILDLLQSPPSCSVSFPINGN